MSSSQKAPSCPASKGNAIEFIQEVQTRFQARPDLYQRFLQAFTEIYAPGKEPKTAQEGARLVQEKMGDIFANDQDLLDKFQSFLPNSTTVTESTTSQDPGNKLDAEEVD